LDPMAILTKPPYPMLAKTGTLHDVAKAVELGYIIEPKIDGIRCLAVVGDGLVQLYNRQLVNITRRFPEVVERVLAVAGRGVWMMGTLVLDGEIYVRGSDGQPDFQKVQHRANRIHDVDEAVLVYPAKYAAFDVLSSGKMSYLFYTLEARKRILAEVAGPLAIAEYTQEEADDLVARQVGEGLMLKHRSTIYDPGARHPGWLKIKWEHEIEAVVGGVTFGLGKREPYFGSLLLGIYRPGDPHSQGKLTYIGMVGTGFDDEALEHLTTHLSKLKTALNPFSRFAGDWDLKYFVHPMLNVKVRFSNWTRDAILRFPRYAGMVD
jgi:bifunctional non-homologous end joining protein LigD